MNGNITKEGIKLDLEWMQRAGLGGFRTLMLRCRDPATERHPWTNCAINEVRMHPQKVHE
jgi:hypothetical protein